MRSRTFALALLLSLVATVAAQDAAKVESADLARNRRSPACEPAEPCAEGASVV